MTRPAIPGPDGNDPPLWPITVAMYTEMIRVEWL